MPFHERGERVIPVEKPSPFRSGKSDLVLSPQNLLRKDILHGLSENPLGPALIDLIDGRDIHDIIHEPVI